MPVSPPCYLPTHLPTYGGMLVTSSWPRSIPSGQYHPSRARLDPDHFRWKNDEKRWNGAKKAAGPH